MHKSSNEYTRIVALCQHGKRFRKISSKNQRAQKPRQGREDYGSEANKLQIFLRFILHSLDRAATIDITHLQLACVRD